MRNLSSYQLSLEEEKALSFGLDHHIPNKAQTIQVEVEFEQFYQSFLKRMQHLPDEEISRIKLKLLNTCQQYCSIKVPYKYRQVIRNLQSNTTIVILKQDKGRGVVIIDHNKYIDKCLTFLNSNQFKKCGKDTTKTIETKIQKTVRKIKNNLSETEYKTIYPTGSAPGKFYGTAKIHKIKDYETVDNLPLRPIISNIGTSSYNLAKYLAKLLSPLGKSEYTVQSTNEFVTYIRNQQVPEGHKLISFDVSALFTNVPLDNTIEIVLKRIYEHNEIQTNIPKEVMKEMLLLCTKNVIFSFNDQLYNQTDGVAMGSPLGPVLANIFMVELERKTIPKLQQYMKPWKRYVDDTIAWIKPEYINIVKKELNSFNPNISFTHEIQNESCNLPFLDVCVIIKDNTIHTTVYRKPTNTDIYLHWESFAPKKWKTCTLKTLIYRAYRICSSPELLEKELEYLTNAFTNINGYPYWMVNKIAKEVKHDYENPIIAVPQDETEVNDQFTLVLPYQGAKGETIIKSLRNSFKRLTNEQQLNVVYTGTKLSTKFQVKDKTKVTHQHNIVYKITCPEIECNATYIGETARRLYERFKDHQGRDINSNVVKHTDYYRHKEISIEDIEILANNNRKTYKRKLLESLYIKKLKPNMNSQQKSIPLKLFM